MRISCAGLNDVGTSVHPVAGTGIAPANGACPANPAGWSNCRPKAAVNPASSVGAM